MDLKLYLEQLKKFLATHKFKILFFTKHPVIDQPQLKFEIHYICLIKRASFPWFYRVNTRDLDAMEPHLK